MWFLNTTAVELLLARAAAPSGLDRASGRLFDEDAWLRSALGSSPPSFAEVSAQLAEFGVTGLTDMSPGNDAARAAHCAAERAGGRWRQRCVLAGTLGLGEGALPP